MNFKQLIVMAIFILTSVMLHADNVQVTLEFIENGPLGSDMYLQLTNTGSTDVVFRNMQRDIDQRFLVLMSNPTGNLIRCKRWQKIEHVKIQPKPGYLPRKGHIGNSGSYLNLLRNSTKEIYTLLLGLVEIPCFRQHYVMFVLRDENRFYTTNVLCFEKTEEHHMKQIDITKSGVPETVSKSFADEIALLYQEEGLTPAAE